MFGGKNLYRRLPLSGGWETAATRDNAGQKIVHRTGPKLFGRDSVDVRTKRWIPASWLPSKTVSEPSLFQSPQSFENSCIQLTMFLSTPPGKFLLGGVATGGSTSIGSVFGEVMRGILVDGPGDALVRGFFFTISVGVEVYSDGWGLRPSGKSIVNFNYFRPLSFI